MTDEKFEEFIRTAAQGYNTPPARAPREEMWNAIQAKRSAGPRVVYGGAPDLRSDANRFSSKVWWAAAAGLVLVASGIGIGRWTAGGIAPVARTAVTPSERTLPTQSSNPVSGATPPAQVSSGNNGGAVPAQQTPFVQPDTRVAATPRQGGEISRVASNGSEATRPVRTSDAPVRAGSRTSAYELAEVNHLSSAEALLTSFRTRSAADQQQDARLASWARELLSNTRLLLDSPVAADPQRRPLLQDLELLLVQIVQLSPGSTPQDREIMQKTLQQDQLMTRLRTAIPAGQRGS